MAKSLPELINIEDFKSLRHLIFLKNETSQTEIVDATQFVLLELAQKYLVIEAPARCAQQGHQVQLFILPDHKDLKLKKLPPLETFPDLIQIVGKISEINPTQEATRVVLTIAFNQFNQDRWEDLREKYQDRQEMIEKIIKLGRGQKAS